MGWDGEVGAGGEWLDWLGNWRREIGDEPCQVVDRNACLQGRIKTQEKTIL